MANYILKKDCPSIGKEEGDYYNNEFGDSIENLLESGVIGYEDEDECCECECHFIDVMGCTCDCN